MRRGAKVKDAETAAAQQSFAGADVAIKKFTSPFDSAEIAKRAYREIRILRLLNEDGRCGQIIKLLHLFTPDGEWNW